MSGLQTGKNFILNNLCPFLSFCLACNCGSEKNKFGKAVKS